MDAWENPVGVLRAGNGLDFRKSVSGVGESLGLNLGLGWLWGCPMAIIVIHDAAIERGRSTNVHEGAWDIFPTEVSTGAS